MHIKEREARLRIVVNKILAQGTGSSATTELPKNLKLDIGDYKLPELFSYE